MRFQSTDKILHDANCTSRPEAPGLENIGHDGSWRILSVISRKNHYHDAKNVYNGGLLVCVLLIFMCFGAGFLATFKVQVTWPPARIPISYSKAKVCRARGVM